MDEIKKHKIIEYEIKVLDIDVKKMHDKLKNIGCKKNHNYKLYKRNVFSLCNKSGFARVRDEGTNVTLTTKIFVNKDFPEEIELTINENFEKATNFMESIGLHKNSFQETLRQKYSHPLAHEITFDMIPVIPTYMEIDCTNKKNLNKLIKLLEIDKTKIRTGSYDKQFLEYYDISKEEFQNTKSLSFKNIKNEIFPKKNKELFEKTISLYNIKKIYKL